MACVAFVAELRSPLEPAKSHSQAGRWEPVTGQKCNISSRTAKFLSSFLCLPQHLSLPSTILLKVTSSEICELPFEAKPKEQKEAKLGGTYCSHYPREQFSSESIIFHHIQRHHGLLGK